MKSHVLSVLAVIAVLAGFGWFVFEKSPFEHPADAATTGCDDIFLSVYGSGSGTNLTGVLNFSVGLSSASQLPDKVTIYADGKTIGQARPNQSSNYAWTMLMPSELITPLPHDFRAKAKYNDGTLCTSELITREVSPATQSHFDLLPSYGHIDALVNTSTPVSAMIKVPGRSTDYSQYGIYQWKAINIGSVSSAQKPSIKFYSGPDTGSGELKALVKYGLASQDVRIPVNVLPGSDPLPTNETSTTQNSTTENGDSTVTNADSDNSQQVANTTAVPEDDKQTKSCLQSTIGKKLFNKINSGKVRPTSEQIAKARACFAKTSYIMPTNFAPVSPDNIEKLPKTNDVKIARINESEITRDEENLKTLKLSGTAKPKSTVFIYIFSEPLVLTVTANAQGEWEYELENPLEPGEHTAYAVVDRGDGNFEKTDPLSFVIGTAEASGANPNGLSLDLEPTSKSTATQSNRSMFLYVASAAAVLALSGGAVWLLLHKKHKQLTEEGAVSEQSESAQDQNDSSEKFAETAQPVSQESQKQQDSPESQNSARPKDVSQSENNDEQNQT